MSTEKPKRAGFVCVRLDDTMLGRLNDLEAKLRGQGRRDCNRSVLIRTALQMLLDADGGQP